MRHRTLALVTVSAGAVVVTGLASGVLRPWPANRGRQPACDPPATREEAERVYSPRG